MIRLPHAAVPIMNMGCVSEALPHTVLTTAQSSLLYLCETKKDSETSHGELRVILHLKQQQHGHASICS
jgi:hypothetical protein